MYICVCVCVCVGTREWWGSTVEWCLAQCVQHPLLVSPSWCTKRHCAPSVTDTSSPNPNPPNPNPPTRHWVVGVLVISLTDGRTRLHKNTFFWWNTYMYMYMHIHVYEGWGVREWVREYTPSTWYINLSRTSLVHNPNLILTLILMVNVKLRRTHTCILIFLKIILGIQLS